MSEMVERVGAAIDAVVSVRAFGLYDYSGYPGTEPPHVVRDELKNVEVFRSDDRQAAHDEYERLCRAHIARAAIAAMREPTTAMINAFMNDSWDEAIDAALATPDPHLETRTP